MIFILSGKSAAAISLISLEAIPERDSRSVPHIYTIMVNTSSLPPFMTVLLSLALSDTFLLSLPVLFRPFCHPVELDAPAKPPKRLPTSPKEVVDEPVPTPLVLFEV